MQFSYVKFIYIYFARKLYLEIMKCTFLIFFFFFLCILIFKKSLQLYFYDNYYFMLIDTILMNLLISSWHEYWFWLMIYYWWQIPHHHYQKKKTTTNQYIKGQIAFLKNSWSLLHLLTAKVSLLVACGRWNKPLLKQSTWLSALCQKLNGFACCVHCF